MIQPATCCKPRPSFTRATSSTWQPPLRRPHTFLQFPLLSFVNHLRLSNTSIFSHSISANYWCWCLLCSKNAFCNSARFLLQLASNYHNYKRGHFIFWSFFSQKIWFDLYFCSMTIRVIRFTLHIQSLRNFFRTNSLFVFSQFLAQVFCIHVISICTKLKQFWITGSIIWKNKIKIKKNNLICLKKCCWTSKVIFFLNIRCTVHIKVCCKKVRIQYWNN